MYQVYALRFPDGLLLLEPSGTRGRDEAAIKLFPLKEAALREAEVFDERPVPVPVKLVVRGGGYRVPKRARQVVISLESK